ncbi:MAG: 3-phosphoshikimate 1-carboxyvinyltransferase [Planctomycetota bacterium]
MQKSIQPVSGPVNGRIRPPGSKSITNRALVCAAMAGGTSVLRGSLESDDTHVMIDSLNRIGIKVEVIDRMANDLVLEVRGCRGAIPSPDAEMFVGNSGTTIRFLTAALGIAGGNYTLDGVARMRERPIGDLVDSMRTAGIRISATSAGGCPPVLIEGPRFDGGRLRIRGDVSSQYLSGLLMAAPLAGGDVEIGIVGKLISRPYVEMTIAVMKSFGVEVEHFFASADEGTLQTEAGGAHSAEMFRISASQSYVAADYSVEPDASAASYFFAAAAICGGVVTVDGLSRDSLQGDVGFVDCLAAAGCKVDSGVDFITITGPAAIAIDTEMSAISDTAQTLAAVSLFLKGRTTITGIGHNRVKETDRIGNLAIELRKLGAKVDEFEDGMSIEPNVLRPAEIDTYDDHRMAMSLSLAGLRIEGVKINDPDCVSKTYPRFFEDLETLTGAGG